MKPSDIFYLDPDSIALIYFQDSARSDTESCWRIILKNNESYLELDDTAESALFLEKLMIGKRLNKHA